jgi:hypothetical protein
MDIGKLAGGIYSYEGEAKEKEFNRMDRCKYDHGVFHLRPVPGDAVNDK